MDRKLRAPGLVLFAVLAIGAFSAPAATAGQFHSELGTDTVLKGSQVGTDEWTFNAGTVKCTEAVYNAAFTGATTTTISLNPQYSGCTAFGFVNATTHYEGECHTEFNGNDNAHRIQATASCKQTVTAFNCWVTIGPQTTSGVTYSNTGAGSSRDIDVTLNITGITYTQHSKSFPGCSSGTRTDGKFTGTFTLQGFNTSGTQVGIWRE